MKTVIGALVAVSALCGFVVAGAARAKNSLMFSAADYPASNWEPYHQRLGSVREAVGRGDNKADSGSRCFGTATMASAMSAPTSCTTVR